MPRHKIHPRGIRPDMRLSRPPEQASEKNVARACQTRGTNRRSGFPARDLPSKNTPFSCSDCAISQHSRLLSSASCQPEPPAAGIVEKIRKIHQKCTDVANGLRFQSGSGFSAASIPNSRPAGRLSKRRIPILWGQIATDPQVFVAIEPGELEDLGRLHRSEANSLTTPPASLRCRQREVEVFGFSRIKRPFRKTLGLSATFAGF